MALLEVEDLRTGYGDREVLHGVALTVEEGDLAVLLGLNRAGKTTALVTLAGLHPRWGGRVLYDGRPLGPEIGPRLVGQGVVLVPEGRRVFPRLSVADHLRLGAWPRRRERRGARPSAQRVFEIFPALRDRSGDPAGVLSAGEQQMLAVGRALMAEPRLLLLDEPSRGLAPALVREVLSAVRRINEQGVSVLLAEQNGGALALATRTYVMEGGRVVFSDQGTGALTREHLRETYLGASARR